MRAGEQFLTSELCQEGSGTSEAGSPIPGDGFETDMEEDL